MSGNAAKEIFDMLGASSQKVEKIVTETKSSVERLMQTGKEKIEHGTVTANRCGDVLTDIVKNVTHLTGMVNEIAVASQEQSKGVGEISRAMQQMDQVTQQNAAATQQVSASADQLSNQSNALNHAAQILLSTVEGFKNGQHQTSPAAAPVMKKTSSVKTATEEFERQSA
jgi:methyl-accepting chemotaxis protein